MKVNGQETPLAAPCTLLAFLESQGYDVTRLAVEQNGNVVPRAKLGDTTLDNADHLEIVSFVGGG